MNALAVSSRERFYEQSRQAFEDILWRLDSEELRLMTHSDLERELEKMGRELMRKLLQEHLEARAPGECAQPVRGSDGVQRSRVRPQERKLETIFGTVSVERAGYGQDGTRSLHPLDADSTCPMRGTPLNCAVAWPKKPQRVPLTRPLRASVKSRPAMFPSARLKNLPDSPPKISTLFTSCGKHSRLQLHRPPP